MSDGWMPVFVALRKEAQYQGSVSRVEQGSVGRVEQSVVRTSEKPAHFAYHRVGTARPLRDGGYSITLFATPVGGKLVLRPPRRGECEDPTGDGEE